MYARMARSTESGKPRQPHHGRGACGLPGAVAGLVAKNQPPTTSTSALAQNQACRQERALHLALAGSEQIHADNSEALRPGENG
jgi:hypothetical protein